MRNIPASHSIELHLDIDRFMVNIWFPQLVVRRTHQAGRLLNLGHLVHSSMGKNLIKRERCIESSQN
ncbi:hypothetical protein [Candidatus Nitrosocosmicus oleophilus]|uniref:hypothetical protein n=1 Tax=Candidatus Nitrosocosmicus oleophilus TaxID=1353260 RepID=UPI0018C9FA05|nr:hypothetical protein [Candidatus Nitrosocosmicus oleophilus]